MGRQDSYQTSLAVIEKSRQNQAINKLNEKIVALKQYEIDKMAELERKKLEAELEKEQIKSSERKKGTLNFPKDVKGHFSCWVNHFDCMSCNLWKYPHPRSR